MSQSVMEHLYSVFPLVPQENESSLMKWYLEAPGGTSSARGVHSEEISTNFMSYSQVTNGFLESVGKVINPSLLSRSPLVIEGIQETLVLHYQNQDV